MILIASILNRSNPFILMPAGDGGGDLLAPRQPGHGPRHADRAEDGGHSHGRPWRHRGSIWWEAVNGFRALDRRVLPLSPGGELRAASQPGRFGPRVAEEVFVRVDPAAILRSARAQPPGRRPISTLMTLSRCRPWSRLCTSRLDLHLECPAIVCLDRPTAILEDFAAHDL
jgi:hypothetical protein